ncbi:MAG: DUF192 domain-containing protein [Synechococcales cyanobacterium]
MFPNFLVQWLFTFSVVEMRILTQFLRLYGISQIAWLSFTLPATPSPLPTPPFSSGVTPVGFSAVVEVAAEPVPTSKARSCIPESPSQFGQVLPISATATINGHIIQLEVARTFQQQGIGLMYRPCLPDNQGMLFVFQPAQPIRFWMRNVLIPLDMVFIRQGRVRAIAANVPPCKSPTCPTYGAGGSVDQVLELRGGRAAELGLRVGDYIKVSETPLLLLHPFSWGKGVGLVLKGTLL